YAMFSRHDPPVAPARPWLSALRGAGPAVWGVLWALGRVGTRGWFGKLDELRREMGLPRSRRHPVFEYASSELHLVLFSKELAAPQPDWPANSVQPGFPVPDRGEAGGRLPLALDVFLRQGTAPIVFTLGSSAVYVAGGFFAAAAEAARALGRRA